MSSGGLSVGELVGTFSLDDAFTGGLDKIADVLGISQKSMGAMAGAAALAGTALVGTATALVALGIQGGKVQAMEDSFNSLTGSIGETGEAMLGTVSTATKGLISDMDIMAASNKAILLGLPVTSESMGTLATAATVLGKAMGQDAKKSLDDLTTALGRSSPMILDNLGLSVKVADANEAYARALGKSAEQLTEAEKKQAFYNAAMAAAKDKVDKLGGIHLTFADRVQQGRVMVENFVDSLGKAVATSPVVAAGMDSIMKSMQDAFGGTQQDTVKRLMGFVNEFVISLTYVGQGGVIAAQIFIGAWNLIKLAILGVMTAVSMVGTGLVSLVAGIAQLAAEIPGAGKLVDGFAAGATALALSMDEVTQGLAAQTGEANAALAGHTALQEKLETVNGAFVTMRDSMEAARDKQALVTAGTGPLTKGLGDVAAAATLTAAQIKAIEDATRKGQEAMMDFAAETADKFKTLQDELTLANLTGVQQRLAEIQMAHDEDIKSLQGVAFAYPGLYEQMTAMVTEKYRIQAAAAIDASNQEIQAAIGTSLTAQQEAQLTADAAIANYARILGSGKATYQQLLTAAGLVAAAERKLGEEKTAHAIQQFDLIANAAKTFIGAVFGKGKVAAIATAIIDTAQAVVKALASAPPPLNYALAAAVGVAGLIQINKIRSTDLGFAMGTPETAFQDFGRGTAATLHGEEAVVTKHQGDTLADQLLGAVAARDDRTAGAIERLHEDLKHSWDNLPILLRDDRQLHPA